MAIILIIRLVITSIDAVSQRTEHCQSIIRGKTGQGQDLVSSASRFMYIYIYIYVYTHICKHRERERQIDRQIDRYVDRQIDRHSGSYPCHMCACVLESYSSIPMPIPLHWPRPRYCHGIISHRITSYYIQLSCAGPGTSHYIKAQAIAMTASGRNTANPQMKNGQG